MRETYFLGALYISGSPDNILPSAKSFYAWWSFPLDFKFLRGRDHAPFMYFQQQSWAVLKKHDYYMQTISLAAEFKRK